MVNVNNKYGEDEIAAIYDRAETFLEFIRERLHSPDAQKQPPVFNLNQMIQLCGVEKITGIRAVAKQEAMEHPSLPTGKVVASNRREFTLDEVQQWARHWGCCYVRQPGQNAAVIAVGNSKGGVGKSTTTANLAQGLSLKGYKVLCIDLDAQGSLTNMLGISPSWLEPDQTFLPLAAGKDSPKFNELIQKTYWSNIDLLPSMIGLNSADFYLPMRQMNDPNFGFYDVLSKSLRESGALERYDYILLDTPPVMSYTTLNGFWAADALLVPLPPEGPDFASSVQFWGLLSELMTFVAKHARQSGFEKSYSWVRVYANKVNRKKSHTEAVMEWMRKAYGPEMMPLEVPETSAISVAGASMGTLYDIVKYVGSARTYARARDAYDQLVTQVDRLTRMYKWDEGDKN